MRATSNNVVARATVKSVEDAFGAIQQIGALAAGQVVLASASIHKLVVTALTAKLVPTASAPLEKVVAGPAPDDIAPQKTGDMVFAGPAAHDVVTGAAADSVVAAARPESVVSPRAISLLVPYLSNGRRRWFRGLWLLSQG